uniref:RNA methyltransferase n=1 Tax=Thermotomaculum hydrothermale TaxID=981385 RepID=UPI0022AAC2C8|nr:RNA methyltransferase [Thermotomaculum hydrothermale]
MALLHYLIKKRDGSLGFTSITNLDIHDIARLSKTFELGKFFVVSPVESQKEHARAIVDHWTKGFGSTYNQFRREAFEKVEIIDTLEDCVSYIKNTTGKEPVIIGTAAKKIFNKIIDYSDVCDKMLSAGFPVLVVFGTGWGLHEEAAEKCHYFLEPIEGVLDYNHLSVRSAVTITVDRIVRKLLYKER